MGVQASEMLIRSACPGPWPNLKLAAAGPLRRP